MDGLKPAPRSRRARLQSPGQPPVKYVDLTAEKMKKILDQHVVKGTTVKEYALAVGSEMTH